MGKVHENILIIVERSIPGAQWWMSVLQQGQWKLPAVSEPFESPVQHRDTRKKGFSLQLQAVGIPDVTSRKK